MVNRKLSFLFMLSVCILVTALIGCAQTPASTTPAQSEAAPRYKGTITVSSVTDLSGPAAGDCTVMAQSADDYARYINEEKGGIEGYKLVIEHYDSKLDPALTMAAFKRYAENAEVRLMYCPFASVFGTAVVNIANDNKYVIMCTSGSIEQCILSVADEKAGKDNYYFTHTLENTGRMYSGLLFVKSDWAKKGKSGVPKIGYFGLDGAAGYAGETAVKLYCKQFGFDYVGGVFMPAAAITTVASQVAILKEAKADYVLNFGSGGQACTLLAKELERVDYHPTLMMHVSLSTSYLESKDPVFEGHMAYQYTKEWVDTDCPEMDIVRKVQQKYHPGQTMKVYSYVSNWHGSMVYCEALRRVVKDLGFDGLKDGENILNAFESIKNFDTNGLSGPVSYNKWDHQGTHSIRWVKCEGGTLVPVTGFDEVPPFTDEQRVTSYWIKK